MPRRFPGLPVLEWVEIEPSEEEEDAGAAVVEVAKPACGGLEEILLADFRYTL